MLTEAELRRLATIMATTGLTRLEMEAPGLQVTLDAPGRHLAPAETPVTAPATGLFRPTHPDGLFRTPPDGSRVRPGQILAFIQSGRLLLPVTTEASGQIATRSKPDGTPVAEGDTLFTLTP